MNLFPNILRFCEIIFSQIGLNLCGNSYDVIGNSTNWIASSLIQYTSILCDSQMHAHPSGSATPNLPSEAELLRCISPLRETSHDADGNLTFDGVFTYAYDADNRLASVSSNGLVLVMNQYDHKGRRVRKTTPTSVTTFLYDGWNLIYEREIAGTVTNETYYYWGKDISGSLQGAGGVGGLLYLKRNGTIYIPHRDANGNIVRYTDAAGNVVASYTYGAFGNTLSATGAIADVFHFRFSTKYYDAETGLYYYGYRFYSPLLMRWINRDPIEEKGSVNIYAFCANNPIANYDRDGRAYFAVRKLKNCPLIVKWSWFVSNPFAKVAVDVAADYLNVEILHEQLFFEDGGKDLENVGWGTDKDGKETYLRNEPKDGYTARDGGYDDCIMRLAVGKVNPDHYQLTWIGKKTKCNCQDYASALRAKYRELENDPEVKCKCKKGK